MEQEELLALLDTIQVRPQIDVAGPIESAVKTIFQRCLIETHSGFRFVKSRDKRLRRLTTHRGYLGESLREVITDLENLNPILFVFTPNMEHGYDISIEYKERDESMGGLLYLAPLIGMISMFTVPEDTVLNGDLQDELFRLVTDTAPSEGKLQFVRNPELDRQVQDFSCEKGTNLGKVFMDLLEKFNLSADTQGSVNGVLYITLRDGGNLWKA